MITCFLCGGETETYHNGFPVCIVCSDALLATTEPTVKDGWRLPNDTQLKLPHE
jgi:hypothetical protein